MPNFIQVGHCSLATLSQPGASQILSAILFKLSNAAFLNSLFLALNLTLQSYSHIGKYSKKFIMETKTQGSNSAASKSAMIYICGGKYAKKFSIILDSAACLISRCCMNNSSSFYVASSVNLPVRPYLEPQLLQFQYVAKAEEMHSF